MGIIRVRTPSLYNICSLLWSWLPIKFENNRKFELYHYLLCGPFSVIDVMHLYRELKLMLSLRKPVSGSYASILTYLFFSTS